MSAADQAHPPTLRTWSMIGGMLPIRGWGAEWIGNNVRLRSLSGEFAVHRVAYDPTGASRILSCKFPWR
jgi:hypothetical protein